MYIPGLIALVLLGFIFGKFCTSGFLITATTVVVGYEVFQFWKHTKYAMTLRGATEYLMSDWMSETVIIVTMWLTFYVTSRHAWIVDLILR